jgi:hypothetical protein
VTNYELLPGGERGSVLTGFPVGYKARAQAHTLCTRARMHARRMQQGLSASLTRVRARIQRTRQAPAPRNASDASSAHHHDDDVADGDGDDVAYYVYNHLEFTVLLHRADAATMAAPSLGAASAMAASDGAPPGALRRAIGSSSSKKNGGGDVDPGWLVVGFEVLPCSVAREGLPGLPPYAPEADRVAQNSSEGDAAPMTTLDAPAACASAAAAAARVAPGEVLSFTYSVRFVESPINWVNRWDAYLDLGANDEDVHWVRARVRCIYVFFALRAHRCAIALPACASASHQFSIMNSLVLVIGLGGARSRARTHAAQMMQLCVGIFV